MAHSFYSGVPVDILEATVEIGAYHPAIPGPEVAIRMVADTPEFLQEVSGQFSGKSDRACLDRFLILLDALEQRALYGCSLLDLGCASGFFAYLFALTFCDAVTAVDDGRAEPQGAPGPLDDLRRLCLKYQLRHLKIFEEPMEQFLLRGGTWDVVLCLSVLHHFFTGYGDNPLNGRMSEAERMTMYEGIGRATGSVLYVEFDHGRVPDATRLVEDLREAGRFCSYSVIGSSISTVGENRAVYELVK